MYKEFSILLKEKTFCPKEVNKRERHREKYTKYRTKSEDNLKVIKVYEKKNAEKKQSGLGRLG